MSKKKKRQAGVFQTGNLKDRQLNPKHTLSEANRFTESDQNKEQSNVHNFTKKFKRDWIFGHIQSLYNRKLFKWCNRCL